MRNIPFLYGQGGASGDFDGFYDAMFTRKAMWGAQSRESYGGAPFDAGGASTGSYGPPYSVGASTSGHGHTHGRHSIERRAVPTRGEQIV